MIVDSGVLARYGVGEKKKGNRKWQENIKENREQQKNELHSPPDAKYSAVE